MFLHKLTHTWVSFKAKKYAESKAIFINQQKHKQNTIFFLANTQ